MHPAPSIIVFTVMSGIGCGMLILFGFLAPYGAVSAGHGVGLTIVTLSLAAIVASLLSSTFHLGHPERAWRALSQWKSSWLSREGIAAIATVLVAALLGWELAVQDGLRPWGQVLAYATAVLAVTMISCTAMIYRSLKPIRQWHHPLVLPIYLSLALATGALWLQAVLDAWNTRGAVVGYLAVIGLVVAAGLKLLYWRSIDRGRPRSDIGSATGLGKFGSVRLFEPPHSADNYLLKEMAFKIARKHAQRLRRIVVYGGFVAPLLLTGGALVMSGLGAAVIAFLAALSATLGTVIERWLFFAEATHTVTLYYGATTA